jgi:hypothetical protein
MTLDQPAPAGYARALPTVAGLNRFRSWYAELMG